MQHKTKYRFEQLANGSVHKLYVYDDVRAQGEFDWDSWNYKESETSAKYFRDQLDMIPNQNHFIIQCHDAQFTEPFLQSFLVWLVVVAIYEKSSICRRKAAQHIMDIRHVPL